MAEKGKKRKYLKRKLLYKYRLVILNQDTFEERFSLRLNRLNVFVYGMLFVLILIASTTLLIAFTGLKEYIPGYSSTNLMRKTIVLEQKTDSLQSVLETNQQFLNSIQLVLSGKVNPQEQDTSEIIRSETDKSLVIESKASLTDSLLREKVAQEDKYNPLVNNMEVSLVLFPPVKGEISEGFSLESKHYAVDIIAESHTPVKSVADGTVIFSEWSVDTGNVIMVKHNNNLISVYKHNASLVKSQGDLVKGGEVIATVGNSGNLTTGPHLHFELWYDGYPINPINFIEF